MSEEELKRLTEKYYNGETTEEEEVVLREYFSRNDIPSEYEAEKRIFSYFAGNEEIPEPSSGFEESIIAGIDRENRQKITRYLIPVLSAAAGLLLIAVTYFFMASRNDIRDTYKDPDIAYAETLKILRNVSSQMNRGVKGLEPVGRIYEVGTTGFKTIKAPAEIMEKNMNKLEYLHKAIDAVTIPAENDLKK